MKIVEQLSKVQAQLKAPKGQHNDFGNYNYRSCEDILEAVKPLLKDQGLALTLDDAIESAGNGGRIYVKATARLQNADGESIENHAFAREAETKKGMDDSQITGAASSYARKYALNGLFLIDDTKDADTNQYHERTQQAASKPQPAAPKQPPKEPMCTANEINLLHKEIIRTGGNEKEWVEYVASKVTSGPKPVRLEDFTKQQFLWSTKILGNKPDKKPGEA